MEPAHVFERVDVDVIECLAKHALTILQGEGSGRLRRPEYAKLG